MLGALIYFLAFFGLAGLGLACFGMADLVPLVTAVLVHELGHYTVIRGLCREPAVLFVSPFFGFVYCDDYTRILTPRGQAVFLLAGCLASLAAALAIQAGFVWWRGYSVDGTSGWLHDIWMYLLLLNAVNLGVPISLLDGGRILHLICSNEEGSVSWMSILAWVPALALARPVFGLAAVPILGLSALLSPAIASSSAADTDELPVAERVVIFFVWALLLGLSVWLLWAEDSIRAYVLEGLRHNLPRADD